MEQRACGFNRMYQKYKISPYLWKFKEFEKSRKNSTRNKSKKKILFMRSEKSKNSMNQY